MTESDEELDQNFIYWEGLFARYTEASERYIDFLVSLNKAGIPAQTDPEHRASFIENLDPGLTREMQNLLDRP